MSSQLRDLGGLGRYTIKCDSISILILNRLKRFCKSSNFFNSTVSVVSSRSTFINRDFTDDVSDLGRDRESNL